MSDMLFVCEICRSNGGEVYAFSPRYRKRHLIVKHDYIYMDGINPVPKPSWWRARDIKGHFLPTLPKQEVEKKGASNDQ